ncbi:MAG: toxin-antitoxin system YwqK family antitoxin [Tenacibaculum sp.]
MKNTTLLFVLISYCATLSLKAQENKGLQSDWQEIIKNKSKQFRLIVKKQKKGYWIEQYYLNGKLYMEGYSSVNIQGQEKFDGTVKYYFQSGKLSYKLNYDSGMLNGFQRAYYRTGELKEEGKYEQGKRQGVWKLYHKNGKIREKGKYKNNKKIGIWKTFYQNLY